MNSQLPTYQRIRPVLQTIRLYILFLLINTIRLYRLFISPMMGQHCRFYPSCSHYSEQAIQQHGICKGFKLSILRLCRCHPWHSGGIDPVPEATSGNCHH